MSVDYVVRLTCDDCDAAITYTNKRPDWQIDAPDEADVAEAERFVAEHKGEGRALLSAAPKPVMPRYVEYYVAAPDPVRYVVCPACGGSALLGSGPAAKADDEASARAS